MIAALPGERLINGSPCSSVIMVSIQRSRLAVITSTALFERFPSESLGLEDLADLLALAFGRERDMALLHRRTFSYSSTSAFVPE